jgi:hypothetical protein
MSNPPCNAVINEEMKNILPNGVLKIKLSEFII